jgi:phospholipid/cholesterol/gamma-HCH transport system substrate-binding protein
METKANYLIIGIFALSGIIGTLGFLLWLTKVQVDRQYAHYEVLFETVSGLGEAGDVRYNGLQVGQVVSMAIDPQDPSKVRVRIEVAADTPVKTDTIAKLQSQGVTGVSYVALSGGSLAAEPMRSEGVIKSERSAIESVLQGAPELLEKAIVLLENINEVVNEENRAAVGTILENLSSASGRLDKSLQAFDALAADLGQVSKKVVAFADRLETLSDTGETTLTTATDTLQSAQVAIQQAEGTIAAAKETLVTVEATFSTAKTLMEVDIAEFVRQGTATATTIETTLNKLEPSASATLQAAQTTFSEAEHTFSSVNKVIDTDLAAAVSDVRRAVNTFTTTVENASADIDSVSQEVLQASRSASNFVGTLEDILSENRRQVSDFLRVGLPEFLSLVGETRRLVVDMDRFFDKAGRDPTRFILGTQGSEYTK